MKKSDAIHLLGGTVTKAARALGVTPQAITQWPEDLTEAIRNRVIASLATRNPKKWPSVWRALVETDRGTPIASRTGASTERG